MTKMLNELLEDRPDVSGNGTDTVVPVGVGLQGATSTEITSGLQEGDTVVLPTPTAPATNAPTGGFPRLGGR